MSLVMNIYAMRMFGLTTLAPLFLQI